MRLFSRTAKPHWKVEALEHDVNELRERYYALRKLHCELVDALGLTRDGRTISQYIRKGGPEQP